MNLCSRGVSFKLAREPIAGTGGFSLGRSNSWERAIDLRASSTKSFFLLRHHLEV